MYIQTNVPLLSLSPADVLRSDDLPHFEDADTVLDLIGEGIDVSLGR
jgi:hypothetical protein